MRFINFSLCYYYCCCNVVNRVGPGVEYAAPALGRLGAQGPFDSGYRSSWAFAGYTGPEQKPWIHEKSRPAGQGPTLVSNLMFTPAHEQGNKF